MKKYGKGLDVRIWPLRIAVDVVTLFFPSENPVLHLLILVHHTLRYGIMTVAGVNISSVCIHMSRFCWTGTSGNVCTCSHLIEVRHLEVHTGWTRVRMVWNPKRNALWMRYVQDNVLRRGFWNITNSYFFINNPQKNRNLTVARFYKVFFESLHIYLSFATTACYIPNTALAFAFQIEMLLT